MPQPLDEANLAGSEEQAVLRRMVMQQLEVEVPEGLDVAPVPQRLAWITAAERRLWGATIVMNFKLGLGGQEPGDAASARDADPAVRQWWRLYRVIRNLTTALPHDDQWRYACERGPRREAVYTEVRHKLGISDA